MTKEHLDATIDDEQHEEMRESFLTSPSTRGHFLKGAAVAAAGLGIVPSAVSAATLDKVRGSAKMAESPSTILNIAATAEAAAVTALYNVHVAVGQGRLNVSGVKVPAEMLVSIVRAALREEQDHLAFLTGAGAKPLYGSFTFPATIFTNAVETLKFFEVAEGVFIAAYAAATREFASGGHNKLAQYAYQIGAIEEGHRVLMRAGLGEMPPNNWSFEKNMFKRVSGAATVLAGLGIFKPNMAYPGAAAVNTILSTTVTKDVTAGVISRRP